MKRPTQIPGDEGASNECSDATWVKNFPVIVQYLTDSKWEDGKPRELSTLSINFSTGKANVGLSDHALQQSVYTTADTVQEALKLLEKALVTDSASWRRWKGGKGKK